MPPEDSAASGAESGPLSVDTATSLLLEPEAPREEDAGGRDADQDADAVQDEIPAEATAEEGETAQPEEAAAEPGEEDEVLEPAEKPAIEAPTSWDADAKAVFAQLPAELQTKVADIQAQRDRQTFEAQQRAAEMARRAEADLQGSTQLRARLDQILPRAQQTFGDRWDNIDWQAWAAQDPGAAYQGEMQMRAERAQLQQLQQTQQQAQAQERQRFLAAEAQKLPSVAPELVDPEKGTERRQELQRFLNTEGIPDQVISQADAKMISLAYDAMRFRALQAQAQQQLGRKTPTQQPARPGLRPTAARGGTSQSRQLDQAKNRLAQTGKVDDAVALLLARGTG